MAFDQTFALTLSYAKSSCMSVSMGALTIGEVFLNQAEYKFTTNSFEVHSSQFCDFVDVLKKIGEAVLKTPSGTRVSFNIFK